MENDTYPSIFIAHGAPPLLDDAAWMSELGAWAQALGRPRAVLVLSAHWEARPVTIGAVDTVPLVYDFYGFPERYYQVRYPSPGAPELANQVARLFRATGVEVARAPERGLDHGAWVPLLAMYPNADVPVLQMSLPSLDPRELFALGRTLAPLRREGVLIAGSGFLTHNMRSLGERATPAWAREFDAWIEDVIRRRAHDELLAWAERAPGATLAHPRSEHLAPVFATVGAAAESAGDVRFPITGYWSFAPTFTRRSVELA